jgi:hypothetical protein
MECGEFDIDKPPPTKRQREDSEASSSSSSSLSILATAAAEVAEAEAEAAEAVTSTVVAEAENNSGETTVEDREFSLKFVFPNLPASQSEFPICSPQIHQELFFKLHHLESAHERGDDPIESGVVTFGRDDWNAYRINVEKRSGEKCEYEYGWNTSEGEEQN